MHVLRKTEDIIKSNLFVVNGVLDCQQLVSALPLFVVKHSSALPLFVVKHSLQYECTTERGLSHIFGQLQSLLFGSLDELKAKEEAHSIKLCHGGT
jgi:hypothetical protein